MRLSPMITMLTAAFLFSDWIPRVWSFNSPSTLERFVKKPAHLFFLLLFFALAGLTGPAQIACLAAGQLGVAVVTGAIESAMARLSLFKVPQLLVGATALSILGFALMMRFTS
jgi:hypothetical protein